MKKEDLIAKGLSEEHADIAIAAYQEEMKDFIPKTRFDEVNEKLKTANTTITTLQKNSKDNEEAQAEITKYKDEIKKLTAAAEVTRKTYSLKEKLAEAGAIDADYIIYKHGGLEKFTFDTDGKPTGVDDIIKPLRESSPHLFKQQSGGGYNPAGGGNPAPKNPFSKDNWNLTEQGKILRENPTQAKQLAAAAGVKI